MEINFTLNGDVVTDISFLGGCNGNLKAISKLCDGMTVVPYIAFDGIVISGK